MIRIGAEPFSDSTMEEKIQEIIKEKTSLYNWEEDIQKPYLDFLVNDILALFQETIEQAMPEKKDHVCRFNDGEQKCDCYYEALDKVKCNVFKAIGGHALKKDM